MQPVIFCHFDALQSDKLHTKDSIPSRFILSLSLSPSSLYILHVNFIERDLAGRLPWDFESSASVHFHSCLVFKMMHVMILPS